MVKPLSLIADLLSLIDFLLQFLMEQYITKVQYETKNTYYSINGNKLFKQYVNWQHFYCRKVLTVLHKSKFKNND